MQLSDLGWNTFFNENFEIFRDQNYTPMRIIRENREKYLGINEHGEYSCEISGKFRFNSDSKSNFPTVGDWVAVSILQNEKRATIHALLPRKSAFSRKVAGQIADEQIVAANIDVVFIVTGLDCNYNLRRIERYISLAWESGAVPVILLNKADLCNESEIRKNEVGSIAFGIDVYAVSAFRNTGLEILNKYSVPSSFVENKFRSALLTVMPEKYFHESERKAIYHNRKNCCIFRFIRGREIYNHQFALGN